MKNEQGFVALVSTIIITSLLLVLIITLSTTSFALSSSGLETADMVQARALAQSCGRLVSLRIAADLKFTGDTTMFVRGYACRISELDLSNPEIISFTSSVVVEHAVAGLEIIVDNNTFEILNAIYVPVAQ